MCRVVYALDLYSCTYMYEVITVKNVSYQQVIQPETIINATILSPVHKPMPIKPHFIQELAIKDWNQLPTHIIECNNLQSFLSQLTN